MGVTLGGGVGADNSVVGKRKTGRKSGHAVTIFQLAGKLKLPVPHQHRCSLSSSGPMNFKSLMNYHYFSVVGASFGDLGSILCLLLVLLVVL
jgi:hypothetical protein